MKTLHLSTALSAAIVLLLPGFQLPAQAQAPEYLCFMTTTSGQVLDLSSSLCSNGEKKISALPVNSEQANAEAFTAEYNRSLNQYPDVREQLQANNQQSPEATIEQAKTVCEDLSMGVSLEQIKINQTEESTERTNLVNAEIVNELAVKHYCPQYRQK